MFLTPGQPFPLYCQGDTQVMELTSHGTHKSWTSRVMEITSHGNHKSWTSQVMELTSHGNHKSWKSQVMDITSHGTHKSWKSQVMEITSHGHHKSWKSQVQVCPQVQAFRSQSLSAEVVERVKQDGQGRRASVATGYRDPGSRQSMLCNATYPYSRLTHREPLITHPPLAAPLLPFCNHVEFRQGQGGIMRMSYDYV